jgi:hypothetical protein
MGSGLRTEVTVTGDGLDDEVLLRAHIRVPDHVVHRSFDTETVLLNLHSGTYHGLNPTGGRAFELLRTTGSLRITAETMSREDQHPVEDVARDLAGLCRALAERELIEIDDRLAD